MTDSVPVPAGWRFRWRDTRWLLACLLLGVFYPDPELRVMKPDLDSSIHASYTYFTAHGFQYGSEVLPTAGPYGFVMYGWDFDGELFQARAALDLLCTLTLAALVLWWFARLQGGWRWAWLASLLLAGFISDNVYSLPLLLGGLFLLVHLDRPARALPSALVAVMLALFALCKGTQLFTAFFVFAIILALGAATRQWRAALRTTLCFVAALLGWWLAAGQNPLHLPAYIQGTWHIATGYNEAMVVEESTRTFLAGATLLALIGVLAAWTAARNLRRPAVLAACGLLAGYAFLDWKHGFVRADGHTYIFLDTGLIVALTLLLLERGAAGTTLGLGGSRPVLAVVAAGVALFGAYPESRLPWEAQIAPARLRDNVRHLLHGAAVEAGMQQQLGIQKQKYNLAAIRQLVGNAPVDFFGHEFGLALLNDFNFQPRPVCGGSFNVYNSWLKEQNLRHLASAATRPAFFLFKMQTIDDRLASADDSLALLALLDLYQPVLMEDDVLLLQARSPAPALQTPRPLGSQRIAFGQTVAVPVAAPDEMVLFSLDLPFSVAGRLRAFVYKAPLVFIDQQGDSLVSPRDRRVIPINLRDPAVLSPALESTSDFIDLFSREPGKVVHSFRLHTARPGAFATGQLTVHYYAVKRPPGLLPSEFRRTSDQAVYQEMPDVVEPADSPILFYHDLHVQYLQAPAQIAYRLTGNERAISFSFGIDDAAYLKGRTDGVDFYAELLQPGQPRQQLARRYLQPLSQPADRGLQQLTAVLPPSVLPGSQVIVRTDPGPNHDGAWDWSFITHVRIQRGPYLREQFPRFNTLPAAVSAANCGVLAEGGRDVLLLPAPGAMTFGLNDGQHELRFTGGLLAGSYAGDARTDGAEFIAELVAADGTTRIVGRRLLQPLTRPGDRGEQVFSFPLPPHQPGDQLRVRTDPGPAGNAAWDWCYISSLDLH